MGTGNSMNRKKDLIDGLTGAPERTDFAIDANAVSRAKSIVASLSEEYIEWLLADLATLDEQLSEARSSFKSVDQLRRKAHDIRGQGGSFGFPLISDLADAMHRIMVSQKDVLSEEGESLSRSLFATMRVIVDRKARDAGDEETRAMVSEMIERVRAAYGET